MFLDATDSIGLVLRVRFVRRGDRYGHTILAVDPTGHEHPLLESIEGTPADDWPASPPLQSLSLEVLAPGRRVALLVGMAGRSHWSASVEPVAGRAALIFDIACRVGAGAPNLGSRYREDQTALTEHAFRVVVEPHSNDGRGTDLIVRQLEQIEIKPAPTSASAATQRWQYRIELTR